MRIALSNASHEWRGTETVAAQLVRGLQQRGHELLLICRAGSPLQAALCGEAECAPVLRRGDLDPRAVAGAATALRRHRSQVVILQKEKDARMTGPAAALVGCPVVVRHETDRPLKRRLHYRVLYGALPAHHITNSEATRQTLLQSAPYLRADTITVLPNAVETERFDGVEPANLGTRPGDLTVGYVGRFEERKGVLDLAQAWPSVAAAVPAAQLFMAGVGPLESQARELLRDAPRVHWLGFRTDSAAVLKALDVTVVPSHFEGFGLTAVEAMAAGSAVVAARASSLLELVEDGVTGRLVDVRSPASLAAGIVELLLDAALRGRLARAGRAYVELEHTMGRMIERHETLLARIAGSGARG